MRKNTMVEMVEDLKDLTKTPYIETLIEKALEGQFHDYRSKAVCGKMYAVECIDHTLKHDKELSEGNKVVLMSIRQNVIEGVYDEDLTDEDRVIMKEEMLNDSNVSEENRKFFFAAMGIK